MPADQRGSVDRVKRSWRARWYENGSRKTKAGFRTKSDAASFLAQRMAEVEAIRSGRPTPKPELTFSELVEKYLERHAVVRSPNTVRTLRFRLARPLKVYGETPLRDLEGMAADLADWRSTLPEGFRYQVFSALRQVLAGGVRWRYMTTNPAVEAGPNPRPRPRAIRVLTLAEIDAIEAELEAKRAPIVSFAAATGLRPSEWIALERRDVDRGARVLRVNGTKTAKSRREVPLSVRALAALDRIPARLDTTLLFPGPGGGPILLNNWRRREWTPAVEAGGVALPCRIYDLRSTFASNALAAGVTVFELARVMGTSVEMIEYHYGALIDGAHAGIAGRLDAMEAALEEAAEAAEEGQR